MLASVKKRCAPDHFAHDLRFPLWHWLNICHAWNKNRHADRRHNKSSWLNIEAACIGAQEQQPGGGFWGIAIAVKQQPAIVTYQLAAEGTCLRDLWSLSLIWQYRVRTWKWCRPSSCAGWCEFSASLTAALTAQLDLAADLAIQSGETEDHVSGTTGMPQSILQLGGRQTCPASLLNPPLPIVWLYAPAPPCSFCMVQPANIQNMNLCHTLTSGHGHVL